MERTLILLKPDAVQRGLVGAITARFETRGLKIVGMKLMQISQELAQCHYAPHKDRDFYAPLLEFMTASPTLAMVLEGNNAVSVTRAMMGATFGPDAASGTIRGDYGMSKRYNLIHGSDSVPTAVEEIERFFASDELLSYERPADAWTYAKSGAELI